MIMKLDILIEFWTWLGILWTNLDLLILANYLIFAIGLISF